MEERKNLLLEIGLEEIPTSLIDETFRAFGENFSQLFREAQIEFERMEVLGTPRRIALLFYQVSPLQKEVIKEVKGPPKKVGMSEDGQFLKPALAFAENQGISPADLFLREEGKGVYIFGRKREGGKEVVNLFPDLLKQGISSLNFSRSMLWGEGDFRFIRPIRWLLALYGDQVVDFQIAGVTASRTTRGHRFLSPDWIAVPDVSCYVDCLKKNFVIVDPRERRTKIEESLEREAQALGAHWLKDEDLIKEVNFLVEYPDARSGHFDQRYLSLPPRVLVTVMKHHQKYFACVGSQGELLPYFLVVLNRPGDDSEKIVKGNERVLRARLEDALFFFTEDRKKTLSSRVEDLKGIVFQEGLGTLWEKTQRLKTLVRYLGEKLQFTSKIAFLERAAWLSKVDLTCEMVKELPELQGYIGRVYASLEGEPEEVASALEEQYQPLPGKEDYPQTTEGSVLSLADRMDTLVASFALGRIPTGSEDPLGLRRLVSAIITLLIHRRWYSPLTPWIEENLALIKEQGFVAFSRSVVKEVKQFIFNRLRFHLLEEGFDYSVINAVLATPVDDIFEVYSRVRALQQVFIQQADLLEEIVTGFVRANNITKNFSGDGEVKEPLLQEEEEKELYLAFLPLEEKFKSEVQAGRYLEAFQSFQSFLPHLHRFFDRVLVMCEEDELRENRLVLLKKIVKMWESFADLSQIVVREEGK
ncbi:MAG: glycyl-tRNA synthetase beta chain [Candidatus Atribacteria bacterium]|nr:glycyl-tRNA synthetase beta chain [Candidatus Atribacteria bacterium]